METHPAVGDSASATTSSASHETKKVESCAIVNEQEDERTCESQSLSTSTTTTTTATTSTTEQDQTNIMVPPLDNYGNNNTGNDEQSINPFINQQEQPQPSDSNSTGRLSNNGHSIVNSSDNNYISKFQHEEEQQHRQQDEQADSDIIDSQQDQNQDTRVIQEEREEAQEQTKIIDQCEQNESTRGVDNDHSVLKSHNVSQDEHVATTTAIEQSDRFSINEEESRSIPREKQSSRGSTNDDQGEPSGTAALDESIAQNDTPSLDENKDEEIPRRAADRLSLSSAQQSAPSEQHSEEGIDVLQIVTEVQGQQEQSNGEHVDYVSHQQQISDHYRNNNDNDDDGEHIVKTGYEREERITDSVTENGNEEHNQPNVDGSEEDIRDELDQTERNVKIESSTSSSHPIEEQQHQLNIQSFPSLEDQSASSQALEGFGLTEGHSDDESFSNTVEQQKQHQVNIHASRLSENQGTGSQTLGGPLPTESNPDSKASLIPTEQQQQVDIQSSRSLEDDSVRSADLEESTPIPTHASDEINYEEQSQQHLPSLPANRTSVNQQNITTYEYQQHSATINHDRDDASDHTLHNAPRSRRVWEEDRQASECRRCNRRFNFLVRRHHCRRCGLVVCDRCSSHRIRLPPEEIVQDPAIDPSHYPLIAVHPQRVCDVCNRLPIKEVLASSSSPRRRATAPVSMSHMKRSPSSQSLMTECPVCGTDLLGMQKEDQEKHLQLCLNTGSPPVRPPRYLVYELSENSPQIDYECPICFEEFKAGEKIARMICLCSYHRHCLSDWLERGKGCPVHYDATISA